MSFLQFFVVLWWSRRGARRTVGGGDDPEPFELLLADCAEVRLKGKEKIRKCHGNFVKKYTFIVDYVF